VACKDFDHQISKEGLMVIDGKELLHFNGSDLLLHLKSSRLQKINNPLTCTIRSLMSTLYSEPGKPDIGYFFDNSKCKPGKQILKVPWMCVMENV